MNELEAGFNKKKINKRGQNLTKFTSKNKK